MLTYNLSVIVSETNLSSKVNDKIVSAKLLINSNTACDFPA